MTVSPRSVANLSHPLTGTLSTLTCLAGWVHGTRGMGYWDMVRYLVVPRGTGPGTHPTTENHCSPYPPSLSRISPYFLHFGHQKYQYFPIFRMSETSSLGPVVEGFREGVVKTVIYGKTVSKQ